MFRGSYANVYLGADGYPPYEGDDVAYLAENPGADSGWYWPYREITLIMKWNDAWLSNADNDCDGLDRHYGSASYINSGAWETNHMYGTYIDDRGKEKTWTYFVKIVAVPESAYLDAGLWMREDDTEIGPVIWGEFATIEEVETPGGIAYKSPAAPGFGVYGAE